MKKALSTKRAIDILTEFEGTPDAELRQQRIEIIGAFFEPYRLNDGRTVGLVTAETGVLFEPRRYKDILFVRGWLYDNADEYLGDAREYRRQQEKMELGPRHILADIIPDSEHFIAQLPGLLEKLTTDLNIPKSRLDGTVESLRFLNAPLKKLERGTVMDEKSAGVVTPIIAYVGEVVRRATGGKWLVRLPETRKPGKFGITPEIAEQFGLTSNGVPVSPEAFEEALKRLQAVMDALAEDELPAVAETFREPHIITDNGFDINLATQLAS